MSYVQENFVFPILIRPDLVIKIVGIPHDLSEEEASRIAKIIMAFVTTDTQPSLREKAFEEALRDEENI